MSSSTALSPYGSQYMAKKAFFTFLGQAFRIYGPSGDLQFYVKQKAFKLKEEITVFADEGATRPMLGIQARQRIDFSATYDVKDSVSGERVGALRRKGMKSLLRDEWAILDLQDQEVGKIEEDSMAFALLRRFLSNLIPQTFDVSLNGHKVGQIKQRFNPFILTYDVSFQADSEGRLDRRLGVAITVLLLAIEGRQRQE